MKKNIFRRFLIIAQLILLISLCSSTVKAEGEIDPTFNGSVYGNVNGDVFAVKTQPDGKLLVSGNFTDVQGIAKPNIARFNTDGSVDTSFNPPDIYGSILAIGVQSDGKIIIGGNITQINGTHAPGLKRLNADGSYDTSFTTFLLSTGGSIYDIEILPDDKILAGGNLSTGGSSGLARFNADGTLDSGFNVTGINSVKDAELQPDGKIVAVGGSPWFTGRFNSDGTADASFQQLTFENSSSAVEAVEILADGKLLVAGSFTSANGFTLGRITRLNADGSLDLNFNLNNAGANNTINDIAVRADGKIIVGGAFTTFNSTARRKIALLNADGTLDATFGTNTTFVTTAVVRKVEALPDNKILAGADYNSDDVTMPTLARFNTDGSLDTTFTAFIRRFGIVREIMQKSDGKILVGGDFRYANGLPRKTLAQFNADGTIDSLFSPSMSSSETSSLNAFDLQPNGQILAVFNTDLATFPTIIRRFNANGSSTTNIQDANWRRESNVVEVVALANGQFLVGGTIISNFNPRYLLRLNSNGSLDATFPVDVPNGHVNKIIVQPDGKILIAGDFSQVGTFIRGRIARLNANGAVDTTFNPPGGANGSIKDVDVQADGKIVVVGSFTSLNGSNGRIRIGRFNADGTLDTSFAQTANDTVHAVKVQPDGKVLIGGRMSMVGTTSRYFFARLNADGSFDSTFNTMTNGSVYDINLQADNKILIGGDFTTVNGASKLRVARLLNSIPLKTPFDFDGDGKTDISIFRPSAGEWWYLRSFDGGNYAAQFGSSTDKLVPGDFTGDGRADIAVFRPSTGEWFILRSEDGSYYSFPFGNSDDIPAVGDFDGDGKADSAVFRPSDTTWYIRRSSDGGTTIQQFGASGDVPAVADYDGDGKSDIAIWRASVGEWWIQKSSNSSVVAFQFGNSADKPVQGDYTGDGKADVAIWRQSTGEWLILRSEDYSYYSFPFGASGDVPAPGDYDGDGKFDATVFRPSSSTWYVQRSTAGTLIQSFGITGDMPVPNAFVH